MNAVVMGRNTWESIPTKFRPLKDRVNVVISRNTNYDLSQGENTATVHLRSDLDSALSLLSNTDHEHKPISRAFVIGGASLYKETLLLPPTSPSFVDRVLLTGILSPSFDECDVFMPDFQQIASDEGSTSWRKASHAELRNWVGFDVQEGVQEEKGVRYEFQMWVR